MFQQLQKHAAIACSVVSMRMGAIGRDARPRSLLLSSNLQQRRPRLALIIFKGRFHDRFHIESGDRRRHRRTDPAGLEAQSRQGFQSPDHDRVLRHSRRRAIVRGLQHLRRRQCDGNQGHQLPSLSAAGGRAADCARLRVRQRLPRYRQRGRNRDLHPLAAGGIRGDVVGVLHFLGVLFSSGAVAFGIVSLLPVELILQVGSSAGFAMVFALLIAAIIWNLGTWYFGLPASSSHTLIGSIIGVGIANQLMSVKTGTSGVDWGQAANIGKSLLLSPIVGFICAALLLMACKALIPNKALYEAPKGNEPPPFYIRALLVLTCTGVSFFHGSNDGQKGMGLIMLILIGTVPTAYAVNHAVTTQQTADFVAVSTQTADALSHYVSPSAVVGDSRDEVTDYIRTKQFTPNTMLALRELINGIGTEMAQYKQLKAVPQDQVRNFR